MRLITHLQKLNADFQVKDGKLEINAPPGVLTPEIVQELKDNKKQIISFLQNQSNRNHFKSIPIVEKKEYYRASSAQKRLYILQKMDENGVHYNLSGKMALPNGLKKEMILKVLQILFDRHENLRTSFHMINEVLVQKIHSKVKIVLESCYMTGSGDTHQASGCSNPNREGFGAEFIKPFDLSFAPLIRVGLLETGDSENFLLIDMHHIIADGVSLNVLKDEFLSLCAGEELPLQKLQYKDYVEWFYCKKQMDLRQAQESYWLQRFAGEAPLLDLPLDFPRPINQSYQGSSIGFWLDGKRTRILRKLAQDIHGTLFMAVVAIFSILCSRLSEQRDICIGTPIAGRKHDDLGNVVGMFVNTLVLRTCPCGDKTLREFLTDVKQWCIEAFENQDYPFEDLVEKVKVNRDLGRNPLFDVMFSLENQDDDEEGPGEYSSDLKVERGGVSHFDLSLNCVEKGDLIYCTFEFCAKLFSDETVMKFVGYFKKILSSISADTEVLLRDIEMIPDAERHQLVNAFNGRESSSKQTRTLVHELADQMQRSPDRVAAVFSDQVLTYRCLHERSNQLARVLKSQGVTKNVIVGIMVDPSFEMLLAILGVLKAGGAYCPIDSTHPPERISYILKDSKIEILLTRKKFRAVTNLPLSVICLDDDHICSEDKTNLDIENNRQDAAYVIYTSGSTGRPKGICVEHGNLACYVEAFQREFVLHDRDVVLQQCTYSFDAFVEEFYPILTKGGKLAIAPKETILDIDQLVDFIEMHHITLITCSPLLLNELNKRAPAGRIHTFISGGDTLKMSHVNNLIKQGRVYNTYGPTETTVCVTYYAIHSLLSQENVPIGKPITNYRVFVLNADRQMVPVGIPGELVVGGPGVTRGYINRTELNHEKYISLASGTGEYLFQTGDLVKWLPDGNLEFLGRIDRQVKIRGFRIELAEIENHLMKIEGVGEAVVVDHEDEFHRKYLCAYITKDSNQSGEKDSKGPKTPEIKQKLSQHLPSYMIPVVFVELESIPLTSSGKVNKKGLPQPEITLEGAVVPPENEIERTLQQLWSDILHLKKEKIGRDSDFFALGGHSLMATILVGKIHQALNVKLPLGQIFATPTLKGIGEKLQNSLKIQFVSIKNVEKKEYYQTSAAQRRLYVLQQMDIHNIHYNIPGKISITNDLDYEDIRRILEHLVLRHEILRTSFHLVNDRIVQKIHPRIDFKIERLKIPDSDPSEVEPPSSTTQLQQVFDDFVKPFNLAEPPLFRLGLLQTEKEFFLFLDIHHIISDGTSHDLLEAEFRILSQNKHLQPFRIQYKDYSEWQNEKTQQNLIKSQKEYWLKEYSGELPVLNLPLDFPRPIVQSFAGANISFSLNEEETALLENSCQFHDLTLFMILFAAFNVMLAKLTGQSEIIVGTPVAGRRHADFENMMGLFVNTLAIKNQVVGQMRLSNFLQGVKEKAINAFENEDYQFEELVDSLLIKRDTSRNPIFDVMFVLQNQSDPEQGEANTRDYVWNEPAIETNRVSKFDLVLCCEKKGKIIECNFEYCIKLFKRETIVRFVKFFKKIIAAIRDGADVKIADIEIFSAEEKFRLLMEFNQTSTDYPEYKTIQQLFEEQANRTPNAIALRTEIFAKKAANNYRKIPGEMDETCCFKRNPYVHRFTDRKINQYLIQLDQDLPGNLILLTTHKKDYLLVNNDLFLFLKVFNGRNNVRSILNGFKGRTAIFILYPLLKGDVFAGISHKKREFFVSDSLESFWKLLDELLAVNLINPAGFISEVSEIDINLEEVHPAFAFEPLDQGQMTVRNKTGSRPVLLMGDTIGCATTGLLYMASYLRRHGIEAYCQWNDLNQSNQGHKNSIEQLLDQIKPGIVGISLKWFPHIARVLEMVKIVKNYDPEIVIVIGGNTASYFRKEIIEYDGVDYVISGDGELPLLKICQRESKIPNCTCRQGRKIFETPIEYVQNRNNCSDIYLSHLQDIFVHKLEPYLSESLYINTGKGCASQCFYCAGCRDVQKQSFNRQKPFLRGVEEVRKDIVATMDYTSTFMFDFDLPQYDSMDYYRRLWDRLDLSEHFCEFFFWRLPSEEFLELIVNTFKYAYLGIDLCSLSEGHRLKLSSLGLVKPQPTDEQLFSFLESCKKHDNLEVRINQIAGLPYFNQTDIWQSYRIVDRLFKQYSCLSGIDWGRLHAQPGAPLSLASHSYDMHSFAQTFSDYLHYSELNLKSDQYPDIEDINYPYIYFKDESFNSKISEFYLETNRRIGKIREEVIDVSVDLNLTYKELDLRSSQIAGLLQKKGVGPNTIVAMILEPSVEMLAGLLGTLKAGGSYLPIDPEYPHSRIGYMLNDSQANLILSNNRLVAGFANDIPSSAEFVDIEDENIYSGPIPDLTNHSCSHNLANIIYTSGTTGKPKGVMINHSNLYNCYQGYLNELNDLSRLDYVLLSNYVFDATFKQLFFPLFGGGCLHLVRKELIMDSFAFFQFCRKRNIQVINAVVSFIKMIIGDPATPYKLPSVKYLLTGGERLLNHTFAEFCRVFPNAKVINSYGPTETTIASAMYECVAEDCNREIPLGLCMNNTEICLFDESKRLVPLGVCGEIYIGGDGLSRGYMNNPELTFDRFASSPYHSNQLLYKTGDLGRRLANGYIEYVGRTDQQVKIRGYRIELKEIENRLLDVSEVAEAIVVNKQLDRNNTYLCAYIVCKKGAKFSVPGIRRKLSKYLPEYMIPAFFMVMDCFPLSATGKIDIKSLPEPDIQSSENYVPPRNDIEERLCAIWRDVLAVEKIGIMSHFFEVGGDSIKAIQVCSRLQIYGLKLSVQNLFKYPRISELSKYVEKQKVVQDRLSVKGLIPLTPIQKWFFQKDIRAKSHFNQAVMLYRKQGFDEGLIKIVFSAIVKQHDILRVGFKKQDYHVIQYNYLPEERPCFDLQVFDLSGKKQVKFLIGEHSQKIQQSINVFKGPLMKLGLFKTSNGDHLLIVIHHLLVDGVSWRIILEDLSGGYQQGLWAERIQFPAKSDSYKQWSEGLQTLAQSHSLLKELPHWQKVENNVIELIEKDFEVSDSLKSVKNEKFVTVNLGRKETRDLTSKSNHVYQTEINDLLLTALALSFSEWAGINNLLINLEGHGRENVEIPCNIGRTVGWFTSLYPVCLSLTDPHDLSFSIREIKEILRSIPRKGMGYGILKYLTPSEKKQGYEFSNNAQVSFNYLGEFAGDRVNNDVFQLSDMPSGFPIASEFPPEYSININGLISQNQLSLDFAFNDHEFREGSIEKLANIYKQKLLEIIKHCNSREESLKTPSDVGYPGLSLTAFEILMRRIKDVEDKAEIKEIYHLSPMQNGMFFHFLHSPDSSMYLEQLVLHLSGFVDRDILERSFNCVISRYDILRTLFVSEGLKEPVQIVLSQRSLEVAYHDLSHVPKKDIDARVRDLIREDRKKTFNLSRDHLLRVSLVKKGEQSYCLVWDNHHILMDGWCTSKIYRDLVFAYKNLKMARSVDFENVPSYRVYIDWLQSQDSREGLEYWRKYLLNYEAKSGLLPTNEQGQLQGYEQSETELTIEENDTLVLNKLSGKLGVTLNTLFQVAWGILLFKYSSSTDVVFGAVVSGRPPEIEGIEDMVGLFINTVPVRIQCAPEERFNHLLIRIQQSAVESKHYEYLSLAEIQSLSNFKSALIDHIMIFENYPLDKELMGNQFFVSGSDNQDSESIGFDVERIEAFEQTNYDLNIIVIPSQEITIKLSFNNNRYQPSTMKGVLGHFRNVLTEIADDPGRRIADIEMLSQEEKRQLLFEFNQSNEKYPQDQTVQNMFEDQVKRTPDRVAVVMDDQMITYGELNRRSNQLARLLRDSGVCANMIVAIMLERSIEMIITILATFKSGGGYLPVEPDLPGKRIDFFLNDSGSRILVTTFKNAEKMTFRHPKIYLDDQRVLRQSGENLKNINRPTDMGYLIYTSGSTGKPKGVIVKHQGILNYTNWRINTYRYSTKDVTLQLLSYAFDGFVSNTYSSLLSGGKLVLGSGIKKYHFALKKEIIPKYSVTNMSLIPSMFKLILEKATRKDMISLRFVVLAGERADANLIESCRKMNANMILINEYGPTENTVTSTAHTRFSTSTVTSNIGQPINHVKVYILNNQMTLCPIGVFGQLYVSGESLARGYLNNPQLSSEKFVNNPFHSGNLLYGTGDIARWLPDGNIELWGRQDQQVKIRGFRIELVEIETCLLSLEAIKEGVVVDRTGKNGDKYLCAYLVWKKGKTKLNPMELRRKLSAGLPDYMIPSHFVELENLPLGENGKLDRKKLPEPQLQMVPYSPPKNDLELMLQKLFSDILDQDKERISVEANFFEMGIHSLHLIKIHSKLTENLNKEIEIVKMFEYPTIREFAQYLYHKPADDQVAGPVRVEELERGRASRSQRLRLRKG